METYSETYVIAQKPPFDTTNWIKGDPLKLSGHCC